MDQASSAVRRVPDAGGPALVKEREATLPDVRGPGGAFPGRRREWAVVAGVIAVVLTVAAVWLAIDRHPPEWDYANHLEHAVLCWRDLAAGNVRDVFGHSSFYPPLVPCLAGLVFGLLPSDVVFGEVVILAFLGMGMAATYVLGRRFGDGSGGVIAATLYGTAPLVVNQALRFQLDVPLASMVAVSLGVDPVQVLEHDQDRLHLALSEQQTLHAVQKPERTWLKSRLLVV